VGANNFAASVEFQYSNQLSDKISWHALVREGSNDETFNFDGGMFKMAMPQLSYAHCFHGSEGLSSYVCLPLLFLWIN